MLDTKNNFVAAKRPHSAFGATKPLINGFNKVNQRSASSLGHYQSYPQKKINSNLYYSNLRPSSTLFHLNPTHNRTKFLRTPKNINATTTPTKTETENRPKRKLITLICLGILYLGIEVLFSMESALAVSILLKLKVPENTYSIVWVISPLVGFLLQPILGVLSDRCQSPLGRRRPFILALAIGAFIGIACLLNSSRIGLWLGDIPDKKIPIYGIIVTGLGVALLDFCADSCNSPLRALILDVCNIEDQDTALNIYAFLGGIGGTLGFIFGAIDWTKTPFKFIGDDPEILFVFCGVIFFTTLILTLTSVKEERFILNPTDETTPLVVIKSDKNAITDIPEEAEDDVDSESQAKQPEIVAKEAQADENEDDNDDDSNKPITVKLLLQSMLIIPRELAYLIICQTLGWLSFFSAFFFLTDFVAQQIYHGDPLAPVNSTDFKHYNTGIKMGCWCLLWGALSGSIYAFILEKILMSRFTTKFLFFFGYLFHGIIFSLIYFTNNIYLIIFLCSGFGILSTTLQTLPFQILSEFHEDINYRKKSPPGTKRGIGTDCALLSACYFLSQALAASYTSVLVSVVGNYFILLSSAFWIFVGTLFLSLFMIFPKGSDDISHSNYF